MFGCTVINMNKTIAYKVAAAVVAGVILSAAAAPTALSAETLRATTAHTILTPQLRAQRMGVTVIVTETPCGHPSTEWGGCFDAADPNVIQVATYDDPVYDAYTVLHELSHVRQWREGLPMTECGADENAIRWGALLSGYDCPGLLGEDTFYGTMPYGVQ